MAEDERETTPPHSCLCHNCFFVERAALIGDVRDLMVSNKEKALAENAVSPPKKTLE